WGQPARIDQRGVDGARLRARELDQGARIRAAGHGVAERGEVALQLDESPRRGADQDAPLGALLDALEKREPARARVLAHVDDGEAVACGDAAHARVGLRDVANDARAARDRLAVVEDARE